MTELQQRAQAVAALADLIAAGLTVRGALREWAEVAPDPMRGDIGRVRKKLELSGDISMSIRGAASLGEDADAMASICLACDEGGLRPALLLKTLARSIDRRAQDQSSAGAATAGTKLQARLVAGLPLLALFIAPAAHVPLFDVPGLATIAIGGVLVAIGMRWMAALIPEPIRTEDPIAVVAEMIAASCDGGLSLPAGVGVALRCAPSDLHAEATRARRLVALGCVPGRAFGTADHDLAAVNDVLERAALLGTPVADGLRSLADRRRKDRKVAFETALRRAPVRMVLPLTLCVLPAFAVLAITPFLRGLAFG